MPATGARMEQTAGNGAHGISRMARRGERAQTSWGHPRCGRLGVGVPFSAEILFAVAVVAVRTPVRRQIKVLPVVLGKAGGPVGRGGGHLGRSGARMPQSGLYAVSMSIGAPAKMACTGCIYAINSLRVLFLLTIHG